MATISFDEPLPAITGTDALKIGGVPVEFGHAILHAQTFPVVALEAAVFGDRISAEADEIRAFQILRDKIMEEKFRRNRLLGKSLGRPQEPKDRIALRGSLIADADGVSAPFKQEPVDRSPFEILPSRLKGEFAMDLDTGFPGPFGADLVFRSILELKDPLHLESERPGGKEWGNGLSFCQHRPRLEGPLEHQWSSYERNPCSRSSGLIRGRKWDWVERVR
ncbi:MAG: hypothetical protein H6752_03050 [Candidatus Omnitrophica bacterium]|nr:hypothetical protein [Candidatus Omnitrophota bacterium]